VKRYFCCISDMDSLTGYLMIRFELAPEKRDFTGVVRQIVAPFGFFYFRLLLRQAKDAR
jgi:hypothetical protein